jgi:hypothetical protein
MRRKPSELSVDELIIRAWQSEERKHAAGWPGARRWVRHLSAEVEEELQRRGFDVELATEVDHRIGTKSLVDQARATFVGTSVIVNQLPADRAGEFGKLRYLVRYFPHDDQ